MGYKIGWCLIGLAFVAVVFWGYLLGGWPVLVLAFWFLVLMTGVALIQ